MESVKKEHVVILVHGLQGNTGHMDYLEKSFSSPSVYAINCKANDQGWFKSGIFKNWATTSDGIKNGGTRIANEIIHEVSNAYAKYPSLRYISFVGSSMGGLFCRYAVGILWDSTNNQIKIQKEKESNPIFLEPFMFTSLATPHLGVPLQNTALSLGVKLFFLFRASISELLLEDNKSNPLLLEMSNPEDKYWKALASFQIRVTYASCHPSEWKVPYPCSAMVSWNYHQHQHEKEGSLIAKEYLDNIGVPAQDEGTFIYAWASQPLVNQIIANLRKLDWIRVNIHLTHAGAAVVNESRKEIASHLMNVFQNVKKTSKK